MIEHALRESLSARLLTQRRDETERFRNRQMRFDLHQRSSLARVLLENASTTHVHTPIYTAHRFLRTCDFHQEHWLLERGLCCEFRRKTTSPGEWHDLPRPSVSRIGNDICTLCFWAITPNLSRRVLVPIKFLFHDFGTLLGVSLRAALPRFNLSAQLFG